MTAILHIKRSKYAAVISILLSTAVTTFTAAFQTRAAFHIPLRSGLLETSTRLATSLSTPTGKNMTDVDDGDDHMNRRKRHEQPTHIQIHRDNDDGRDPTFNEFHKYLHGLSRKVKNGAKRANLMDDELKRLETKYYQLSGEDAPQCRYEPTKLAYHGPRFRPDEKTYAMVINAYARSGLGRTGALLAEAVAERFEKRHPGQHANAFLLRGIVKAWINAGDLQQAEKWLNKMEERYDMTQETYDAPSMIIYSLFLNALANSRGDYKKQAGELAIMILNKMRDGYLARGNSQVMPTLPTYLAVMRCQGLSDVGLPAVTKMLEIYRQLEQDYEDFGKPLSCKPTSEAVMPIIEVATRCRGSMESVMIAEEVLQGLQKRFEETNDPDYRPVEYMYTRIFSAYSKMNSQGAAKCSAKVDDALAEMEKNGLKPSIYSVTTAIRAKVNDRSDESLEQAEAMLRRIESPDAILYQSLIKGYCRNGNAEKADQMLQELEENFETEVMSIAMCLHAWSKLKIGNYDQALERSEYLLDKIISKYRDGLVGPKESHVDTWVFEALARLWVNSRKPGAGDKIVALIEKMEQLHENVPGLFYPTDSMFVLALDAMAATERTAGHKALALLEKFERLSDQGILPPPSVRVYSSALNSLTSSTSAVSARKTCEIYQTILQKISSGDLSTRLTPSTLSNIFRTILRSDEKDAESVALDMLQATVDVARRHPSLVPLNTVVFTNILSGLARRQSQDEALKVLDVMKTLADDGLDTVPDEKTYTCVALALASKNTPAVIERIDNLLSEVIRLYENGKLVDADIHLFNAILEAYSNAFSSHDEAFQRAYDLLMRLEVLGKSNERNAPDKRTYRLMCELFSKNRLPETSTEFEAVFNRAKALSQQGLISELDPDFYYAAITSYVKDGDDANIEKAESLIAEMQDHQKKSLSPNGRIYNRMLAAYAHSGKVDKAARAAAMLGQMRRSFKQGERNCEPSAHSYNSVILAAAMSEFDSTTNIREIFEIALDHFKALHTDDSLPKPNSSTYEFFIRACSRLLPPGNVQAKLASQAFRLCRDKGLVTPPTVKFIHCIAPDLLDGLETAHPSSFTTMGDKQAGRDVRSSRHRNMEIIPDAWCFAVPETRRKKQVELGKCSTNSYFN